MEYDLKNTPFGHYGSYLAIHRVEWDNPNIINGLYIRNISARAKVQKNFLRIELHDGFKSIPFDEELKDDCLRLASEKGFVEIVHHDEDTLVFQGDGVGIKLIQEPGKDSYHTNYARFQKQNVDVLFNNQFHNLVYQFSARKGQIKIDSPWDGQMIPIIGAPRTQMYGMLDESTNKGEWSLHLHDEGYWKNIEIKNDFIQLKSKRQKSLQDWTDKLPSYPDKYKKAGRRAAYLLWSGVKKPQGILARLVTFSGLTGFDQIWGWDNLFEGLALEIFDKNIAWNNLVVRFDHLSKTGASPQTMNDQNISYLYPPRPLEGWTLDLMKQEDFDLDKVREFFPLLRRSLEWWFKFRSQDGLICHYWHGNDSGADNATSFDQTPWIEAPDLNTYLVLQCEGLAKLALLLNKNEEAMEWQKKADLLANKLIKHFWNVDSFTVRRVDNGKVIPTASLLSFIPFLLGDRLPKNIIQKMKEDISRPGHFLCCCGLTSENQTSPLFRTNGYWRGLVWPSWTYLIVDGLKRCKEISLAKKIAKLYCDNCLMHGFNENYHPFTGENSGCASVLWGPSVFLLFLNMLFDE